MVLMITFADDILAVGSAEQINESIANYMDTKKRFTFGPKKVDSW